MSTLPEQLSSPNLGPYQVYLFQTYLWGKRISPKDIDGPLKRSKRLRRTDPSLRPKVSYGEWNNVMKYLDKTFKNDDNTSMLQVYVPKVSTAMNFLVGGNRDKFRDGLSFLKERLIYRGKRICRDWQGPAQNRMCWSFSKINLERTKMK